MTQLRCKMVNCAMLMQLQFLMLNFSLRLLHAGFIQGKHSKPELFLESLLDYLCVCVCPNVRFLRRYLHARDNQNFSENVFVADWKVVRAVLRFRSAWQNAERGVT